MPNPQPLTLASNPAGSVLWIGPASTPEAEAKRAALQAALDQARTVKTAPRRARGAR